MYTKEAAALPPGALEHPSILLTDGGGRVAWALAWLGERVGIAFMLISYF